LNVSKTIDEKLAALTAIVESHVGQLLAHDMLIAALITSHPDKPAALASANEAIEVVLAQAIAQSKSEAFVQSLDAAKARLSTL